MITVRLLGGCKGFRYTNMPQECERKAQMNERKAKAVRNSVRTMRGYKIQKCIKLDC